MKETGLRIGSLWIENRLLLAPMAGVTDLPFRLLCRRMGAGLVYTEMVSAKAILYKNRNTEALLHTCPEEEPVVLQLFGSEPEVIGEAAARLKDRPFAAIDLNMGCPVPKVAGNGEGSALMKNPHLVEEIVRSTAENAGKPVTVKIRKGFDEAHANCVEAALAAQEGGAAAVAVHGRTREQYYSGRADWDAIRRVKEALRIPVIGNGDVTDPASAKAMLEQTGVDALMIGRAARGNPWIFRRILTFLETGEDPGKPDRQEVLEMAMRHARMQAEEKGEMCAVREMRKHIAWYTAGFPHSARLRAEVNGAETLAHLQNLLTRGMGAEYNTPAL